jgi:hypothetical protein
MVSAAVAFKGNVEEVERSFEESIADTLNKKSWETPAVVASEPEKKVVLLLGGNSLSSQLL